MLRLLGETGVRLRNLHAGLPFQPRLQKVAKPTVAASGLVAASSHCALAGRQIRTFQKAATAGLVVGAALTPARSCEQGHSRIAVVSLRFGQQGLMSDTNRVCPGLDPIYRRQVSSGQD